MHGVGYGDRTVQPYLSSMLETVELQLFPCFQMFASDVEMGPLFSTNYQRNQTRV